MKKKDKVQKKKPNSRWKEFREKSKHNSMVRSETKKLIHDWAVIMANTKTYTEKSMTFEIVDEEMQEYGWTFKLLFPKGLDPNKLEHLTPIIQSGLGCSYFLYKIHESNEFALCQVIYSNKLTVNKVPFKAFDVKPYELVFGVKVDGSPIVIDINESPHSFLAGATGRGKNGSLNMALISLMVSNSPEDVKILFFSGDKGDGGFYEYCNHVYAYSEGDLDKLNDMLDYAITEMEKRKNIFSPMIKEFKGDNLYSYNKLHPMSKLPYIYVVIDEFLSCTPKKSDANNKRIKDLKFSIEDKLTSIAQFGRSYGVVYIISHQKPEKDLCPTFLKNMSSNRICFGYDDGVCSEIVLGTGDTSALGLPPRRAIFKKNGLKTLLFTTNLSGKIQEYLKPLQNFNRKDLFKDIKREQIANKPTLKTEKEEFKVKSSNAEPVKQDIKPKKPKSKEEKLLDHIKSTQNYIPYNDTEKKILEMLKGDVKK